MRMSRRRLGATNTFDLMTRSKLRRRILCSITQPMTAAQLARFSSTSLDFSAKCLRYLKTSRCFRCLNPESNVSRLYWLTSLGKRVQEILYQEMKLPPPSRFCPTIDWKVYGKVCFSHRSMVVQVLTQPMTAVAIRRKAYRTFGSIRLSTNNARDVLRFLVRLHIAELVEEEHFKKLHYRLTRIGLQFQKLLLRVRRPVVQR